jgi:formiminoglutamase
MTTLFEPVDSKLFFSRGDASDMRFGDLAKALPAFSAGSQDFLSRKSDFKRALSATLDEALRSFPDSRHFVLAGFPDDEGIRVNGGRAGASQAPDVIRKPFYKMTPQLLSHEGDPLVWDLGNLRLDSSAALKERHELAQAASEATLFSGARWLSLGGGHDYGFPDAAAYINWARAQGHRPLVINFDAHLDVRPLERGLSSGTPFYRMLEFDADIDFAEIGIQGHCNSRHHLEWVRSRGARVLTQEQVEASGAGFQTMVEHTLGDWLTHLRPAFISIDIDGFSSAVAPGSSQSWATGFTPSDFFPLFQVLLKRLDVRALGIYEVSPPLDHDDRTAKLAAQILHRFVSPY